MAWLKQSLEGLSTRRPSFSNTARISDDGESQNTGTAGQAFPRQTVARYALYSPLSAAGDEIRVVVLYPGKRDADIVCKLTHVSLQKSPIYEALSYTWGDLALRRPIHLGGRLFDVTLNLESALRHLRRRYRKRTLWVDALCINQDDVEERSKQVLRMGTIYQKAQHVCVWLGGAADDSDAAMDFMKRLPLSPRVDSSLANESLEGWRAVSMLADRPWFSRRWVIQEVSFASTVTVLCGEKAVDFSNLALAADALLENYFTLRDLLIQRKLTRDTISDNNRLASSTRACKLANSRAETCSSLPTDLQTPLLRFDIFEATDPRDVFYALLSLASDTQNGVIVPDYSNTVGQVFRDCVEYLIRARNSLNLICYSSKHNDTLGLPSWVPNWSQRSQAASLVLPTRLGSGDADRNPWYTADNNRPPHVTFSTDRNILIARGVHYDRIDRPSLGSYARGIPAQWYGTVILTQQASETDFLSAVEQFWRTMMGNRLLNGEEPPASYAEAFEECLNGLNEDMGIPTYQGDLGTMSGQFSYRIRQTVPHRAFVVTRNGHMGLVPEHAQEDDMVCVLFGCSVPVILRKRDDGGFQLIGESYIHGMMDGAAMKDFENGKVDFDDFALR
ncbi:hypothetical protein MMC24_007355 [Lignoscripta atroalba]|nr:hypothetical protein [Lignoscripta atroalba]